MMQFGIKHYDFIGQCPEALRMAVRGWLELLDNEMAAEGEILIGWDHKLVVAFAPNETELVGILTWSDQEYLSRIWINLVYIRAKFRRCGCHAALFSAMKVKAFELGRARISGGAACNNKKSRTSIAKQGRKEVFVINEWKVNPQE
jgi:hypothetical protein